MVALMTLNVETFPRNKFKVAVVVQPSNICERLQTGKCVAGEGNFEF